jgi:hypothetical protein
MFSLKGFKPTPCGCRDLFLFLHPPQPKIVRRGDPDRIGGTREYAQRIATGTTRCIIGIASVRALCLRCEARTNVSENDFQGHVGVDTCVGFDQLELHRLHNFHQSSQPQQLQQRCVWVWVYVCDHIAKHFPRKHSVTQ